MKKVESFILAAIWNIKRITWIMGYLIRMQFILICRIQDADWLFVNKVGMIWISSNFRVRGGLNYLCCKIASKWPHTVSTFKLLIYTYRWTRPCFNILPDLPSVFVWTKTYTAFPSPPIDLILMSDELKAHPKLRTPEVIKSTVVIHWRHNIGYTTWLGKV